MQACTCIPAGRLVLVKHVRGGQLVRSQRCKCKQLCTTQCRQQSTQPCCVGFIRMYPCLTSSAAASSNASQWPFRVSRRYQDNAKTWPNIITTDILVGFGSVQWSGVWLGSNADLQTWLASSGYSALGSPQHASFQESDYITSVLLFATRSMGLQPSNSINSLALGPGELAACDPVARPWSARYL